MIRKFYANGKGGSKKISLSRDVLSLAGLENSTHVIVEVEKGKIILRKDVEKCKEQ